MVLNDFSYVPKLYTICRTYSLPQKLTLEGFFLPKLYTICWNFILRFWIRKIINSLRSAFSVAQLKLFANQSVHKFYIHKWNLEWLLLAIFFRTSYFWSMNFGRKIQIVFNRQKIINNSWSKPLCSLRDMQVSEN